jgi:hypothetical protein
VWPLLNAARQGHSVDLHSAVAALAADIQYAVSGHAPTSPGGTHQPPGPPASTGSSP